MIESPPGFTESSYSVHQGNIPCIRERRAFNAVHLLQGMIRTRDPDHPMDIP